MSAIDIACPHCGAANLAGGAFCESCGKALPSLHPTVPRIVDRNSLPATAAGGALFGDQLLKQTRQVAVTLLVVGIVQIVIGSLVVLAIQNSSRGGFHRPGAFIGLAVTDVIGLTFIGLSFWARRSPLPASIVGLVLYSTLVALNVFTAMQNLSRTHGTPTGVGGFGIGWLDIVIIAFLVRGIQASLTRRRLLENQA